MLLTALLCVGVGFGFGVVFWLLYARRVPAQTTASPLDSLSEAISTIDERVDSLEKSEVTRNAMVADSLDRFSRLYKRLAERQSREDRSESTIDPEEGSESPLTLRRRLRG